MSKVSKAAVVHAILGGGLKTEDILNILHVGHIPILKATGYQEWRPLAKYIADLANACYEQGLEDGKDA